MAFFIACQLSEFSAIGGWCEFSNNEKVMVRQIFVDTETTGFDFKLGHRRIEFGAVEMLNRKLTGKNLHFYFKPDIAVEAGAFKVHGISNEFLADKPVFADKVDEIMGYLEGAELIIHNAAFDVPFLNSELSRLNVNRWKQLETYCRVLDTLVLARKKHPGQKNSLDALCTRYGVSNKHRTLHGALLDAELLAEVYLLMTGGQIDLFGVSLPNGFEKAAKTVDTKQKKVAKTVFQSSQKPMKCSAQSLRRHQDYLNFLDEKSIQNTLWRKLSKA